MCACVPLSCSEGLDASVLRAEEFTALKEARLRGLGAEILSVDSTYAPDAPEGGGTGAITTTTRIADAAAKLLGPQVRRRRSRWPDGMKCDVC